jgi:hypothetical protein
MNDFFTRQWSWHDIEISLWYLIWFSLPISLKLTGTGVILLLFTICCRSIFSSLVLNRATLTAATPFFLFFFWQARELADLHHQSLAWKETEQNLSLIVIPLLYGLTCIDKQRFLKISVNALATGLLLCSLIIIPSAVVRYLHSGDPGEFIYHQLASPVHTGAIFFSLYLLYVLIMGKKTGWFAGSPSKRALLMAWFIMLLLLMASKLLIITGLTVLFLQYRQQLMHRWKHEKIWLFLALGILALGSIPLLNRLHPLLGPNPAMAFSENFKHCPEPNGLQLRLIFWRFGIEILNEQQAWLNGTGMVNAQPLLNEKIVGHGMYLGTGIGTDTGYLNYNFHNQFLETLVRQGIPGLMLLIWILVIPVIKSRQGDQTDWLFWLIMPALFMTESVLERQAGIVFFCLVHVNRPLKNIG